MGKFDEQIAKVVKDLQLEAYPPSSTGRVGSGAGGVQTNTQQTPTQSPSNIVGQQVQAQATQSNQAQSNQVNDPANQTQTPSVGIDPKFDAFLNAIASPDDNAESAQFVQWLKSSPNAAGFLQQMQGLVGRQ